jgi:phosphoribosylanthranilate isomerase
MATRIKVCCIASVAEARLAASLGASALGLVAAMPSGPGPIDDALIATIATHVPPPVSRFLLTSRTAPGDVVAHVRATHVDTVQLVDAVPEATYTALREALPHVRIVQVLHVEGEAQIAEARRAAPHVHALLLDSGRPSAKVKELGGTGRVHDWSVSAEIVRAVDVPVFLAGACAPTTWARPSARCARTASTSAAGCGPMRPLRGEAPRIRRRGRSGVRVPGEPCSKIRQR